MACHSRRAGVFVASIDGRLIALDAKSGEVAWDVDTIVDHERGYTDHRLDLRRRRCGRDRQLRRRARCARGYVTAYDIESGEQRWRFFTVPAGSDRSLRESGAGSRGEDLGSELVAGKSASAARLGRHGLRRRISICSMSVSATPALYPRKLRSPSGGDNLYVSSILALNAKTGRLAWHYQTTPGRPVGLHRRRRR